jgi:hypothetical protein
MKTLLLNGCSFGECWTPSAYFLDELGMDSCINISKAGTSFQRTARSLIEWIAQNYKPGYVMIPITFAHRWELALNTEEDQIDGSWLPLQNSNYLSGNYNLQGIEIDSLKKFVDQYYGLIPTVKTYWDKIFTDIILLAGYLDKEKIPYVMWDMCNGFDKKHIKGYKGFEKINLINDNPSIIDIWSFCGNKFMWGTMTEQEKKKTDPFAYHHGQEQYSHLEKHILQHIAARKQ